MPTLSDVFAGLQVTPAQGAAILQGLAKDLQDTDPELTQKVNGAVNALLYAPDPQTAKEEPKEPEHRLGQRKAD
jgi:hypothetical protein